MSRKSNFRLYRVWDGIIQRCCNQNAKNYHNYGGRGIFVCDEWRNDFSAFEEYCISNGWKAGLQIDRVDNDGNYCSGKRGIVYDPDNKRENDCPLISMPKGHGRLIDGDELASGCDEPFWCRWLSEIEDAPTIVPAELEVESDA